MGLEVFAEAFKVIGNPLVIAKLKNSSSEIVCSGAVFVDLMICQKRELILQTLFPSEVDSVTEETTTEASDSTSKEFPSILPNKSSASVSDQASDGHIKDEINMVMNADCLDQLESFGSQTDLPCLNRVSPNSITIKVSQFFLLCLNRILFKYAYI